MMDLDISIINNMVKNIKINIYNINTMIILGKILKQMNN